MRSSSQGKLTRKSQFFAKSASNSSIKFHKKFDDHDNDSQYHDNDYLQDSQICNKRSKRPRTCSSFGYGKRTELKNSFECQKFYDIPTTIGEGPKITIHKKIERKRAPAGPAPNTYNPSYGATIPTFLFGISKRELFKIPTTSPGPIYEPKYFKDGPEWGFGNLRRKFFSTSNNFPGPGSYEKSSTLCESRITFKGRAVDLKDKYIKTVPGPGTYNVEKKIEQPLCYIGKASRGLDWTMAEKNRMKSKGDDYEMSITANPNLRSRNY